MRPLRQSIVALLALVMLSPSVLPVAPVRGELLLREDALSGALPRIAFEGELVDTEQLFRLRDLPQLDRLCLSFSPAVTADAAAEGCGLPTPCNGRCELPEIKVRDIPEIPEVPRLPPPPPLPSLDDLCLVEFHSAQTTTDGGVSQGCSADPCANGCDVDVERLVRFNHLVGQFPTLPGCLGLKVLDLLTAQIVVVSPDGRRDPAIPGFIGQAVWNIDEYLCVFPEVPARQAAAEQSLAALEPEVLLNGGTGSLPLFVDDGVTPVFFSDVNTELLIPDLCATPGIQCDSVEAMDSHTDPGPLNAPGRGSGPRLDGQGHLELRIYFPNAPGDPQKPEDGCNMQSMDDAVAALESQFSVDIQYWCYITFLPIGVPWWDSREPSGVNGDGTFGPTTDEGTLTDRLAKYVRTHTSWAVAQNNRFVTSWVREAGSNGIAEQDGFFSLNAESAILKPDSPHQAIAVHEIGHQFSGDHYPADDWRRYVCNIIHIHWNKLHIHHYVSVMNYCRMYWGHTDFDGRNRDIVWANIHDP